jgi:hypothetical protein
MGLGQYRAKVDFAIYLFFAEYSIGVRNCGIKFFPLNLCANYYGNLLPPSDKRLLALDFGRKSTALPPGLNFICWTLTKPDGGSSQVFPLRYNTNLSHILIPSLFNC